MFRRREHLLQHLRFHKQSEDIKPPVYDRYSLLRGWDGSDGELKVRYQPQLRGVQSWDVPGTINGIPVNALPDWGSSVDAISEKFAQKHGIKIEPAEHLSIRLPGGSKAESYGQITGHFQFQGESRAYERSFRVLRRSVHDMVLGRSFLHLTKTLTDFSHRIVSRMRPCLQKGSRLFLLDESPHDQIRCKVNGVETAAFPDTGSDLIIVSGDFCRRNNFEVRREASYRRQVELIDGSFVRTDGMVLGAELSFDDLPTSSSPRELDYYRYLEHSRGLAALLGSNGKHGQRSRTTFICDLHVIENLPCPIILSGEFIFQNDIFSRFRHLFTTSILPAGRFRFPSASKDRMSLEKSLMFIRLKRTGVSWFSSRLLRRGGQSSSPQTEPSSEAGSDQGGMSLHSIGGSLNAPTWQELWEIEERRRNQIQLWVSSMSEPRKSQEQRAERQRREEWDRAHPRPSLVQGLVVSSVTVRPNR